ncbi:unnamed protein product [Effrenium voratum]|uniref:Uncharacterized protein n=1 Tax=Effrenium voratum TaxID=2562239 RepID=A0AA36IHT7_9DINO|nr:unnamed protein product [Effrenium voratum]CAJ1443136.1 unnamed protein product [Effrenium voratum]
MAPKKRPAARSSKKTKSESLKFLPSRAGHWTVSPETGKQRRGAYSFDPSSGCLSCGDAPVGRLLISALGAAAASDAAKEVGAFTWRVVSGEIMEEIQNKENAGAFFVLPSQMNAAEYPDCKDDNIVVDVDDYRYDHTAGPRGQLAAHPAVGQFLLDNAKSSFEPKGLNALTRLLPALSKEAESVPEGPRQILENFELQNGYLAVPSMDLSSAQEGLVLRGAVRAALAKHLPKMRSLAVLEAPARGLRPSLTSWSTCRHRVNLVYASAVPVNAYNNATSSSQHVLLQRAVGSLLLRGAYFGALRLALAEAKRSKKKSRIFLLPLGGGVFNNPRKDIAKAMVEAMRLAGKQCRGQLEELLDVRILTWKGKPEEATNFEEELQELGETLAS